MTIAAIETFTSAKKMRRVLLSTLLGLWMAERPVLAFSPSARRISASDSLIAIASVPRHSFALSGAFYNDFNQGQDDDDSDDEDDDEIDPDSLGDWRLFRKNLASAAMSSSSTSSSEQLGANVMNPTTSTTQRPRSVSKPNEEILKTQSEALYDEYVREAWAHTIARVRSVGLLAPCYVGSSISCCLVALFIIARSWWSRCSPAVGSRTISKPSSFDCRHQAPPGTGQEGRHYSASAIQPSCLVSQGAKDGGAGNARHCRTWWRRGPY